MSPATTFLVSTPSIRALPVLHPVLSGFVELPELDLTILLAQSGETRPISLLDAAARQEVCLNLKAGMQLWDVSLPMPDLKRAGGCKLYETLEKALRGTWGAASSGWIYRSARDTNPLLTSADNLEAELCRDEDCDGAAHLWLVFQIEPACWAIWHINPTSCRLVPPSPALLRR